MARLLSNFWNLILPYRATGIQLNFKSEAFFYFWRKTEEGWIWGRGAKGRGGRLGVVEVRELLSGVNIRKELRGKRWESCGALPFIVSSSSDSSLLISVKNHSHTAPVICAFHRTSRFFTRCCVLHQTLMEMFLFCTHGWGCRPGHLVSKGESRRFHFNL